MRICSAVVLAAVSLLSRPMAAEEIPDTPLPIKAERAFPKARFRRPLALTNAGDGSGRLFIASQYGVVHVTNGDRSFDEPPVFLDIESRVRYYDKENEEGLLGIAFHPRFKQNREFFLYYTTRDAPHTSVISRFRASATNPNQAEQSFEEELMRVPQPFWNHNGGGLAFGPDGYLYISLGDGGAANDPNGNGQNLATLLGSILRIDVDHQDPGKKYAIPSDNPFVNRKNARGEIWAYGLRNVWGMTFDSATGALWAADVGQDTWEEIDIIERGGNYGWNLREAKHKFKNGADPRPDLIEPIWEYHHDVGKSITGGVVYRGKKFPELEGCFLYADYISGKLWALKYDTANKRVVANYVLKDYNRAPIVAFGADEQGEVYLSDTFGLVFQLARESP